MYCDGSHPTWHKNKYFKLYDFLDPTHGDSSNSLIVLAWQSTLEFLRQTYRITLDHILTILV